MQPLEGKEYRWGPGRNEVWSKLCQYGEDYSPSLTGKERIWNRQVSAEGVKRLRALWDAGVSKSEIAFRFAMSKNAVYKIAMRQTYKHIE